ncbi:MAG: hypothetical protein FJ042_09235 [Candidatus Cloacimonetes bacterium]|nr:hypothetical protein [Candidatus Cloacimonadota bacterium]
MPIKSNYHLFNIIKRRCDTDGIACETIGWDEQVEFIIRIPEENLDKWKTLLDNYRISDSLSYEIG